MGVYLGSNAVDMQGGFVTWWCKWGEFAEQDRKPQ